MAAADVEEIRATSYVGFDSITQQIEHKLLKRGFQFNVIVVGACWLSNTLQSKTGTNDHFTYVSLIVFYRPNRSGEVNADQHHFRVTFDRLEGTSGGP